MGKSCQFMAESSAQDMIMAGCYCLTFLLSPAFSKKSGGILLLAFRDAWCVACVARRVVPNF